MPGVRQWLQMILWRAAGQRDGSTAEQGEIRAAPGEVVHGATRVQRKQMPPAIRFQVDVGRRACGGSSSARTCTSTSGARSIVMAISLLVVAALDV